MIVTIYDCDDHDDCDDDYDDNGDDDCDDHDDCDKDQDEDTRARLWAQPCTPCDESTPLPRKVCFSIKVKQFRAVI